MIRRPQIALVLAAAALVALVASGCSATVKSGSVHVAQTAGLGPVHVQLETCTFGVDVAKSEAEKRPVVEPCIPIEKELKEEAEEEAPAIRLRPLLAFAVPPGTTAPATIAAVGRNGSPSYTYTRSAEVGTAMLRAERQPGDSRPWPPAGTEIVGYSGPPFESIFREYSWTVDAPFGLPPGVGGAPYSGTFTAGVADGLQLSAPEEGFSDNRPVNCEEKVPGEETEGIKPTYCTVDEGATIGVSDLKLGTAPATVAFPGAKQIVKFPAAFASTAAPPPALALSGTTTLPGGVVTGATPTLAGTSAGISVAVPKKAKPGKYPVTLTATATGGGAVSQAGTLTVKSAKPKFGKTQLNKAKGTALVAVKLPGAGTLTVSGKGLAKVTKKAKKAQTLKVAIKANGPTAAALATVGKASLKPKFKFKPSNGAAASASRSLVLKLAG